MKNKSVKIVCISTAVLFVCSIVPLIIYFAISEKFKISRLNEDWDTFSYVIGATVGLFFSALSSLILVIDYVTNKKDKQEEKLEKLTGQYIDVLKNINQNIMSIAMAKNAMAKTIDEIFESLNKEMVFSIWAWIFIKEIQQKTDFKNFPKIAAAFNTANEQKSFLVKTGHEQFKLLKQNLVNGFDTDQVNEITNNYYNSDYDVDTIFKDINEYSSKRIIENSEYFTELNNLLFINSSVFRELAEYEEGQKFYFLNYSYEEKIFIKLASLDKTASINTAVDNIIYKKDSSEYELLFAFFGK